MNLGQRVRRWTRRLHPLRRLTVVVDAAYRLPLTTLQPTTGFEPRRADLVHWWLVDDGWLDEADFVTPPRLTLAEMARVHTGPWLEQLSTAEGLAGALGLATWDIDVDAVMDALRLIAGGTLLAARLALRDHGPVLNLGGGFHHAFADHGGGLCAINDVAIALAALRHEGWQGRVGILDLDAHPPDGTLACLRHLGERIGPGPHGAGKPSSGADDTAWLGSLSGADWGPLPGADETVLPARCDDATYLRALRDLLGRMPRCDLTFVLAGGDVLATDPLGQLGLTLPGAAARDRLVARHLNGQASLWLAAGGYTEDAWKVLCGSALTLIGERADIAEGADPLARHFRRLGKTMAVRALGEPDDDKLDLRDVEADLGLTPPTRTKLLGFYTGAGIEYGLYRLGVFDHLHRLGYRDLRIEFAPHLPGERLRVLGQWGQQASPEVLIETCLERQHRATGDVLFVHWLELRHPRAAFGPHRQPLPGQKTPGLGMAREAAEVLANIANRLQLSAVAMRPAWFHVAYTARYRYRFAQPAVQAEFEALIRDLQLEPELLDVHGKFDLPAASRAITAGRVRVQRPGEPVQTFRWPAEEMLDPITPTNASPEVEAWRDVVHFSLTSRAAVPLHHDLA